MTDQPLQNDLTAATSVHQAWPQADPLIVNVDWLSTQIRAGAIPDIAYEWLPPAIADERSKNQEVIVIQLLDPMTRTRRRFADSTDSVRVLVAPSCQWRRLVDSITSRKI